MKDINGEEVAILREQRYKDKVWFDGGWLAYRHNYANVEPGGLYWVRGGDTPEEALTALNYAIKNHVDGEFVPDFYTQRKRGILYA